MSEQKKFRTVKQIWEHYCPEKKPKTGAEIATELLEKFWTALRAKQEKAAP